MTQWYISTEQLLTYGSRKGHVNPHDVEYAPNPVYFNMAQSKSPSVCRPEQEGHCLTQSAPPQQPSIPAQQISTTSPLLRAAEPSPSAGIPLPPGLPLTYTSTAETPSAAELPPPDRILPATECPPIAFPILEIPNNGNNLGLRFLCSECGQEFAKAHLRK